MQKIDIIFAGKPAGQISVKADWQPFSDGSKKAKETSKKNEDEKFYERWYEEKVRKLTETEALIGNFDFEIEQNLKLAEDLKNQAAVDIAQVR